VGEILKIAGIRFKVVRWGESNRRYIWLHGDERTARDVLLLNLAQRSGSAFLVEGRERHVRFRGGELDPNRMFSRAGAEDNLRLLNPGWSARRLERALRRLDRDRERFVQAILPPPDGLLIALHNNSEHYSVVDETPESDRVSLNDPEHPHEFFLCTTPADFDRLAESPYNVVLQQQRPAEDDGSLSRLAVRRGVRYVNVEAGSGEFTRQMAMVGWLEEHLP
jgi:hypothetical protein